MPAERIQMKTRFNINFFKKELEYMFISGRIAGRIEFFLKDEVTEVLPFARKVFKYVYLYENQDGRTDLMYSFKKDALNSLIFHTRLVEQGDINSIRVTGEILGYPECCINAYINDRLYLTVETGINWFLRRINAENGFESEINPFNANIRHIPCSLNCTVTLKNLRLMSKIFGNTKKSDKRTAYITPLPFSYEENDEKCIRDYAEIRIISIEKDRIRYCLNGRTPPKSLSVIKDGDTLEFENGIISVMDKNRDAGRLVLSHFLWSPLTIPDRDFYRNLFETALNYSYISSLFSNSDFCSRDQRYI
ncbi:MAG: DUF483 domain-containing protein, partial [Deltaproteobacteria bacterium]|nr:DUF483 domain-containing protein [Deltaproteobacteria bacterium]